MLGRLLHNDIVIRVVVIVSFLGIIYFRYTQKENYGSDILFWLEVVYYVVLIIVYSIRKKALKHANYTTERIVPAIAVGFSLLYGFLPTNNTGIFPIASSLIGFGLVVQTLAAINLHTSYSIFVEVREMVTGGLYRLTRHPSYLGLFISMAGLLLLRQYLFGLLMYVLLVAWTVFRAILEERKLVTVFPAYTDYQRRVAFLVPFVKLPARKILTQAQPATSEPVVDTFTNSKANEENTSR